MEATGYYHIRLAYFLLENSIAVSIENPLSIKALHSNEIIKNKDG